MTEARAVVDPEPAPSVKTRLLQRMAWLLVPALGLVLVWQLTPLKAVIQPHIVADFVGTARDTWWAPPVAVLVSAIGCLLMVPLTLVVLAHGAIFSFPMSWAVATTSMLLAALVLYYLGRRAGDGVVDRMLPDELRAQLNNLGAKGVLGLAALRWIPVAHFGLLSMSLGALGVPVSRFMLSTLLGQTPVVTLWVVLGDRIRAGLVDPNLRTLGLLIAAIAATIGLAVLFRFVAKARDSLPGRSAPAPGRPPSGP